MAVASVLLTQYSRENSTPCTSKLDGTDLPLPPSTSRTSPENTHQEDYQDISSSSSSTHGEIAHDLHQEFFSKSACNSTSPSAEDVNIHVSSSDENAPAVHDKVYHHTTFNESSYEAHVLQVASNLAFVDSIHFDKLEQSSTH